MRLQLLKAALDLARGGDPPQKMVEHAKGFEAWIMEGKNEDDQKLRFQALELANEKFRPAGIEGSLTDVAEVIYAYLRPAEVVPADPPQGTRRRGGRKPTSEAAG